MAALTAEATTVTTTATLIDTSLATGREAALLRNNGAVTVYLGGSGVTTSTGFPLAAGESLTLPRGASVYGIVASGTCNVRSLG